MRTIQRLSEQAEWLHLIDTCQPFLAPKVVEEALPQGFESIESARRQRLRSAYEEWQEAVDTEDHQLAELHQEWIRMVLREALEYDDALLLSGSSISELEIEEGGESISPEMAVRTDDGVFRLLINVYGPSTDLHGPISDVHTASPVERMTQLCRGKNVRVGLLTNGDEWIVINAPIGSTSGYGSWYARFWWQEPLTFRAFCSLLGVRRLFGADNVRLDSLLERSITFQQDVTDTLGEQVRRAVELLVQSLARADQDRNGLLLKSVSEAELYEAGLTVMMRLVFLLCAEERGLLLLGDAVYDRHYAISTLRSQLREDADHHGLEVLERRFDAWSRILSVFRIIYGGVAHESLRMAALGGSLFDPDRFPFLEGRAIGTTWLRDPASPLPIDNRTVLLLVEALQILEHKGGAQLLSYRALDVEQIGHVYEGLLEYTVVRIGEVTVGLIGSHKAPSPHMALSRLESLLESGIDKAVEELEIVTGRSASTLKKQLERRVSETSLLAALHSCGGDDALARRIAPFVHLIRTDSWDNLVVYVQGSVAVVYGGSRRETGSHYTPRSLTELIVEKTLEPIVYRGPSEGLGRSEWMLKRSEELLDLKICDPAMGSGAFLVQACRYLAGLVTEAWAREEAEGLSVCVDGCVHEGLDGKEPMSRDAHDRLMSASRIVAERCLYGVDVNPIAVELAKLSIWLVTLCKGRPFGFLNHNFRCGDSLIGLVEIDQVIEMRFNRSEHDQIGMFSERIKSEIDQAIEFRRRMRAISIRDFMDIKEMSRLHALSRVAVECPLVLADALISEVLVTGNLGSQLERKCQALRVEADSLFSQQTGSYEQVRNKHPFPRIAGRPKRSPLHWCIEFPEVFCRKNPGFDAIVGNPPFLGTKFWKSFLGEHMSWQAQLILGRKANKTDLCVLFQRRVLTLLRESGAYGLLGTTNISEGTSIGVGLGEIVKHGSIYFARKRLVWPGKLDVHVSVVCFFKGEFLSAKDADGSECDRIGPRLEAESSAGWLPQKLDDGMFSFVGVQATGQAFLVTPNDHWYRTLEAEQDSLLRPYVTGRDIGDHSLTKLNRFALDILDRGLNEIEMAYPEAARFLESVVRPTRTENALKSYKGLIDRWWQFWCHRADQVRTMRGMGSRCVVFSRNLKHPVCMLAPSDWIFTDKVVVVGMSRPDILPICLSSPFALWLGQFRGGTMKRIALTITIESISSFPVPEAMVDQAVIDTAEELVQTFGRIARNDGIGLTALMDRVNDPLHTEVETEYVRNAFRIIDAGVCAAYGWQNLDISRDYVDANPLIPGSGTKYQVAPASEEWILERLVEMNRCRSRSKDSAMACT